MTSILFHLSLICTSFFSSGFFQRLFGGERKLQVGGASTIRPSRYIHPTFSSAPVFSSPPCQSAFPGWYKGERMQPVPAHTAPASRRSLNSDFTLFRLLEFFVSYWPLIPWTSCADSNRKKNTNSISSASWRKGATQWIIRRRSSWSAFWMIRLRHQRIVAIDGSQRDVKRKRFIHAPSFTRWVNLVTHFVCVST